eukprot:TRINITY_DN8909_c0_g1_i1.p1 TRINITY_DN8909_c0_g1~~TRINITY_DN8909_c0_g1_i1.p1  ORF type:complete len:3932 (+),score=1045.38 TRINITY_DN8909_c0_g1_i1:1409-11797(+)
MVAFDAMTWNMPQVVAVEGVDDRKADGPVTYTITSTVTTTDANYGALAAPTLQVTNADNEVPGVRVVGQSLVTNEDALPQTFTVQLDSEPSGVVNIDIVSSMTTEVTVDRPRLVFIPGTGANSATNPQTVTVTGRDDPNVDGPQTATISLTIADSLDGNYPTTMVIDSVMVTNNDNDAGGITVSKDSGDTYEDQTQPPLSFSVVLHTPPLQPVTVSVASTNDLEGTVSPTMHTFDGTTWHTPWWVEVQGKDDDVKDGDEVYTITVSVDTEDAFYKMVDPTDVTVTNIDDDVASVTVTRNGLVTSETPGAATARFAAKLTSKPPPGESVVFQLSLDTAGLSEGSLSRTVLSFTEGNWNQDQEVVVTGLNDDVDDGDQDYVVRIGLGVSTHGPYNGLDPADLSFTNIDDDTAAVAVAPTMGLSVNEGGGTTTFTVTLATEPKADVSIPMSCSLPLGSVPSALVFTPTGARSQTVTVTGVGDEIDDDNVEFVVILSQATGGDSDYNAIDPDDVTVANNDDDTAAISMALPAGVAAETPEDGSANPLVVTVVLGSRPKGDVALALAASPALATVVPANLLFRTTDWKIPQDIVVTTIDDDVDVGARVRYEVTATAASTADTTYDGRVERLAVFHIDNDDAGVEVLHGPNLRTKEDGGTAEIQLRLKTQPQHPVTIGCISEDTTEGALSVAQLEFTASDWNEYKTVTATGQHDLLDDGEKTYNVVFTFTTDDDAYKTMTLGNIPIVNEPLTCAGFVCSNVNDALLDVFCPGAACTQARCCQTSCSGFTCSLPKVLTDDATATVCPGAGCDAATCCDDPCSSFPCASGTVALDKTCSGAECTQSFCCGPTCASFTCTAGFLAKATAGLPCSTGVCDDATCCDTTCQFFTCPDPSRPVPTPPLNTIRCDVATQACSEAQCCNPTCATFNCGASLARLPNAAEILCDGAAAGACSMPLCCYDACAGVTCTDAICHTGSACDPQTGTCTAGTPAPDLTPCNDGTRPTGTQSCRSGVCVTVITCNGVDCGAPTDLQCHEMACVGVCTEVPKADGTACNDGDALTSSDQCVRGECKGSVLTCATYNDPLCSIREDAAGVVCGQAGCTSATCCSTCASFDRSMCESGLVRTGTICPGSGCSVAACCVDLCDGVACGPSDECHSAGVCDPTTGLCTDPALPDNTPCNDGITSTTLDACKFGVCTGSCAVNAGLCTAVEPACNTPACSDPTQCMQSALPDGTACNDGKSNTLGDRCAAGVCTGTPFVCGASVWAGICHMADPDKACPLNGCTMQDCCSLCLSVPVADLGCEPTDIVDYTAPCAVGGCGGHCCLEDKCKDVVCVAETPCHLAGVCDSRTGLCTHEAKADGAACDDGNPQTTGDRCVLGQCTGDVRTEEIGVQFSLNAVFDEVTANRVNAADFIAAIERYLRAALPAATTMEFHNICRVDSSTGVPVLPSCMPGSAIGSLPESGSSSARAGETFVHVVAAVPADSNMAAAADAATVVGAAVTGTADRWLVIEPDLPVHTGKCIYTVCPFLGHCFTAQTCDPTTGLCPAVPKADGSLCNDGDADTSEDQCQAGACSGVVYCNGSPCRATHTQCYVAACESDVCSQVMKADGTPCSDGDPETGDDRCRAGVCRGVNLCDDVECVATSQCSVNGVCDPQSGRCSLPNAPDGRSCDDGDVATGGDKCVAGQCFGSLTCGAAVCFPLEPQCHTVSCENNRCVQSVKENYSPCDDNNPTTIRDYCMFGKCTGEDLCLGVVCSPVNECHERGYCDPRTGHCTTPYKIDGMGCNDGDPTTNGDKCNQGICVGSTVCQGRSCAVQDAQCQSASCREADGTCQIVAKADGTPCMDIDPRTVGDRCVRGSCIGTDLCASVVCRASDSCHDIGVCDPMTGLCTDPAKVYGTACDDGNPDTDGDKCINAVCVGGITCGGITCLPPLLQCSYAVCDAGQCATVTKDGGQCNDGNVLTFDDTCSGGRCVGVDRCAGVVCRASDTCHEAGTCDPKTGLCTDKPVPDGSICDDSNVETTGDSCHGGMCFGVAQCGGQQCVPRLPKCTTATCDGDLCSEVAKPDGTACDDDNPATFNDRCSRGTCVGALQCGSNACIPSDPQCHMAACINGACADVERPEGTQCSDGFATTINDRCYSGRCTGTTPCDTVVCAPSDSCHQAGTCDPRLGVCSDPVKADGSTCSDGDPLTTDDQCVAGVCVGMIKCDGLTCVPPNPVCAVAKCDDGACAEVMKPTGTQCNDGRLETVGDVCSVGACIGVDLCANVTCEAEDYCHEVGTCNPLTGLCGVRFKPDGTFCNDGLFHTADDRCSGGVCVGTVVCGGGLCAAHVPQCQIPVCVNSVCSHNPKPDGTPCNDGDSTTVADSCSSGICVGVDPCQGVVCSPRSSCHDAGLCRLGVCTQPRKPDGHTCDGAGSCFSGTCVTPRTCEGVVCPVDEPQCHTPVCQPDGCALRRKDDGETCDDGDDQTAGDRCVLGGCAGSVECQGQVCSEVKSQCHVPYCDAEGVCAQKPKTNGIPCNDENPLTTGDVCINGDCIGENKCLGVTCAGGSACQESKCNHRTGLCEVGVRADGTACDDGDSTTSGDQCFSETCVGRRFCSGVECPQLTLACVESFCNAEQQCDERPKTDGEECSDGNVDTIQDKCQSGVCVGWLSCSGDICVATSPACSVAECVNGQCVQKKKPNGAACSDFNANTAHDVCMNGACTGTDACASVSCVPVDTCHDAGMCIKHLGICTSPQLDDGAVCNDGLDTTVSDICTAGSCSGVVACAGMSCKPANPQCNVATCQDNICVETAKADHTPCNDGSMSTMNDRCIAGVCTGDDRCAEVECVAQGPCRSKGTCNPLTGVCSDPIRPDGSECNDGEAGTANDVCHAGVCVGSIKCGGAVCYPSDPQCHVVSCSNGQCVDVVKANRVVCNDGNWSTVNDACTNGACYGEFSYCVPNPCGAKQACISGGLSTTPQFTCLCNAPLVGRAVGKPAVCVAAAAGCAANAGVCTARGQTCVDSGVRSEWYCVCAPPERGAREFEAATCLSVADPAPAGARVVVEGGMTKEQFLVNVAGSYGVDPARVTVIQRANDLLEVAFHGDPVDPPGTQHPSNNLDAATLHRKFLEDAGRCQSPDTPSRVAFCNAARIDKIDYAGTACPALTLGSFCKTKTTCSWHETEGKCEALVGAAADSDDDDVTEHLYWVIPVAVLCVLATALALYCFWSGGKKKAQGTKKKAYDPAGEQNHPLIPREEEMHPEVLKDAPPQFTQPQSPDDSPAVGNFHVANFSPDDTPAKPAPEPAHPLPPHAAEPQSASPPQSHHSYQFAPQQPPPAVEPVIPPVPQASDPTAVGHFGQAPAEFTSPSAGGFALPITRNSNEEAEGPRGGQYRPPLSRDWAAETQYPSPYTWQQGSLERGSVDPPRRVSQPQSQPRSFAGRGAPIFQPAVSVPGAASPGYTQGSGSPVQHTESLGVPGSSRRQYRADV